MKIFIGYELGVRIYLLTPADKSNGINRNSYGAYVWKAVEKIRSPERNGLCNEVNYLKESLLTGIADSKWSKYPISGIENPMFFVQE